MMMNIVTGRGVKQCQREEPVILVSSLHQLQGQGLPFVFTDSHAYCQWAHFTIIYEPTERYQNVAKPQGVKSLTPARALIAELIDGFESPFGMELLSTVDWLVFKEGIALERDAILKAMGQWPAGERWAQRKTKLFDGRTIDIALKQLARVDLRTPSV